MDENVNCLTKMEKCFTHEILKNRSATFGVNDQAAVDAVFSSHPLFARGNSIFIERDSYQDWLHFFVENHKYVQNYSLNRMIAFLYRIANYPFRTSNSWCPAHIWSRSIREEWVHAHIFYEHWLHVQNNLQSHNENWTFPQKSDICIWNMLYNREKKTRLLHGCIVFENFLSLMLWLNIQNRRKTDGLG